MTPEPITTHNRQLLTRVAKETRTFSRYPAVSEQVECLPLETGKLRQFAYNPSISSSGGLMAYRYHISRYATRLAVARLGDNGSVISDIGLRVPGESKTVDDPRFFTHDGADYISWVEANWDDSDYGGTMRCVQKFAKFDQLQHTSIQQNIGKNNWSGMEKNWIYFSHDGRLFVVYECSPAHRVFEVDAEHGGEFVEHASPGVKWPYGQARGGTAPLPYEGKLLRFFHSQLQNEFIGARTRYYIGAYLMNPEPPFEVVRVSKRPLLFGSEIGTVKKKDCPHWKANVVFASGAVEKDGGWVLSVGENDSACLLCRVKPEQLNF